jgi:hypothetical protein
MGRVLEATQQGGRFSMGHALGCLAGQHFMQDDA